MTKQKKELYIIECMYQKRADYWMSRFIKKFSNDIVSTNQFHHSVETHDAIYYFWNKRTHHGIVRNHAIIYDEDAIHIILDDPERHSHIESAK